MKRFKGKEILKAALISVISIGILSAGFIGLNGRAFAAATNGGNVIPLAPVSAQGVTAPIFIGSVADDFVEPTFTIELMRNDRTPGPNAITSEQAAMLGAMYIWDMFGICINGMHIEMWYSAWPSQTRTYWSARVLESPCTEMDHGPNISFNIDSVTGERIDIFHSRPTLMSDEAMEVINAMRGDTEQMMAFRSMAIAAPIEIVDEYKQIALDHAARHFTATEVVTVEFSAFGVTGWKLDSYRNLTPSSYALHFIVTDNTGREAFLSFEMETGKLLSINTQHNDVIPGFDFYNFDRSEPICEDETARILEERQRTQPE